MKIYALHGFLGRPADWQSVLPEAVHVDLFKPPIKSFEVWAAEFNSQVEPGSLLVGYSLGGRLALHALAQNPALWKGGVIVSANPGLDVEEREARLKHDLSWAKKFLNDPWEKLMAEWNSQPVFAGRPPVFERREEEFDRGVLAMVLEKWSLGRQEKVVPAVPLLWITGETAGTGHRVPWEAKSLFQQQVKQFIGEIL